MPVQFLGWEDPLVKGMATHSSILALGNPIDRGVWQATVCGVEKVLDMTQQVNNQPPHQYSLICFISWTAHATVNLFIAVLVGR